VETHIDAKSVGGSVTIDFSNPLSLYKTFQSWERTRNQSPVPLTVSTRSWIDSADVQEIVNLMSPADKALFNSPVISLTIQGKISEDNAMVFMSDSSIKRALTWKETRSNEPAQSCLSALRKDVSAKLIKISSLDDAQVVIIQEKFLQKDYSWFESGRFEDRYQKCVAGINKVTPAPPVQDLGVTDIKDAWVEIFEHHNFRGSRLRIDSSHHQRGIRDYRHIRFTDKASSVRWQIPLGQAYRMYKDDNYRGNHIRLDGNGYIREIDNLKTHYRRRHNLGDWASSSRGVWS